LEIFITYKQFTSVAMAHRLATCDSYTATKASLHLWKSNMMVKTVLIISHYFQFPWIKYK